MNRTTIDRVAREFIALLRHELGPEAYAEMVRMNRTESDPRYCASHSFIDANELMQAAFARRIGIVPDLRADADRRNWSEVWSEARRIMDES